MSEMPTRRGIDPQLLYGLSLLGGLALAWPSLASAMKGNTDIIAAGIRLLLSIAFVWTGGYLITTMLSGYARTVDQAASATAAEGGSDRRAITSADGPLAVRSEPIAPQPNELDVTTMSLPSAGD